MVVSENPVASPARRDASFPTAPETAATARTASSAKGQADFSNLTAYATVNVDSVQRLDSTLAPNLPTAYAKDQITLDFAYWAKNGPAIATRWNEWLVK